MATSWDDPSVFGSWGEPAFVVTFGDFGIGKSFDATLFAPDAWTLSGPGALKGVHDVLGPEWYAYAQAMNVEVRTLPDVTLFLQEIAAGRRQRLPVRIDDLTITAQNTLADLNNIYDERRTRNKFEHFKRTVSEMKEAARRARVHVIGSTHIQRPHTDEKGSFTKGGPAMGAPSACSPIYASADVIYRVEAEEGRFPHPAVYRCDYPSNTWAFKDRHNGLNGVGPANLREIFLHVGMYVPRPEPLRWMDDYVEAIAQEITGGRDKQEVWGRYREHLIAHGTPQGHVYWVLRDGLDRAAMRMRQSPMDALLA